MTLTLLESHPGLAANERAYEADDGRVVAVRIALRPDGDDRHLVIEMDGRLVDEAGATMSTGMGPAVSPMRTATLRTSGITSPEQVQAWRERAAERQAKKTLAHLAAMASFLELME